MVEPQFSPEDLEEAKKITAIRGLVENFGKEMSDDLQNLWLDLLAPYSAALVGKAVMRVISSYEYKTLPPFAVLKAALDELAGVGLQILADEAVYRG